MAEVAFLVYFWALKIYAISSFETTVDFQLTLYPRIQDTLYILLITEIHSIRPDSSINRGIFTLRRLYSILNSSELQELFYCLHITTCRHISRKRFSEEIRFLEANHRWVLNTCFLGYANERCRFFETNTSLWNQQAFSFKRTFNKHFLGCRYAI
jgi:hypothetical protein